MRTVAVEISKNSVWLAVGSPRGKAIVLERLLRAPIEHIDDATSALTKLVKTAGVRGSKCVGLVRRSDIELRITSFPTGNPNEIPEMLKFSTTRLFANANEVWPVDFLLLESHKAASGTDQSDQSIVLAAAMPPAVLNRLQKSCAASGLELQSAQLAPLSLADLVLQNLPADVDSAHPFLIADGNDNGTELTICKDGRAWFLRHVRTPLNLQPENSKAIAGELKRTVMAAAGGDGPVGCEWVMLLDASSLQTDALAQPLAMPVHSIAAEQCFDLTKLHADDVANSNDPVWFALASSLAVPLASKGPPALDGKTLDFLNPRERIEVKRSLPKLIAVGALVATLLLLGVWQYFSAHRALNMELAELTSQTVANKDTLVMAEEMTANYSKLDVFLGNDVNWLDQLAYVSTQALPAEEMVIGPFVGTLQPVNKQALISINVGVTQRGLGPQVEYGLRNENHSTFVNGWNASRDENATYPWVGSLQIVNRLGEQIAWKLPQNKAVETSVAPVQDVAPKSDTTPEPVQDAAPKSDTTPEPVQDAAPKSDITSTQTAGAAS